MNESTGTSHHHLLSLHSVVFLLCFFFFHWKLLKLLCFQIKCCWSPVVNCIEPCIPIPLLWYWLHPPNNGLQNEIWETQSRCRPGCSINVETDLLHLWCWARLSRRGGWGEAVQRQEGATHRCNYILCDSAWVAIIFCMTREVQSPNLSDVITQAV